MKLTHSIILPALCWTARLASAASAHIYFHDPQSQPRTEPQSRSLEPVAARLVLAQRAGVEGYHSSDLLRAEVIDAINDYGVRTPLFAAADSSVKKAFILLEGESEAEASMSSLKSYSSFTLHPAPASPASRGLFVDLAKQSDPKGFLHLSDDDVFDLLKDSRTTSTNGDMFYIAKSLADFKDLITRLAETEKWIITALVMPSSDSARLGQDKFQWGTYEMPGVQAPLRKRQRIKEEPLTETHAFEPVQSFTAPITVLANNTQPLRGILPACFSTQSACESATRNCTGHGSCSKKYHDRTASKDGGIDCYSCSCKASKNNGRTTSWGGPACQKKDISVQFWLIALFTIGMIFLVGFAVGTVWEMGSEELPSVIGAGVTGPTARK